MTHLYQYLGHVMTFVLLSVVTLSFLLLSFASAILDPLLIHITSVMTQGHLSLFRSFPGDELVDWNSGVSIRTSVRPQNFFPISI